MNSRVSCPQIQRLLSSILLLDLLVFSASGSSLLATVHTTGVRNHFTYLDSVSLESAFSLRFFHQPCSTFALNLQSRFAGRDRVSVVIGFLDVIDGQAQQFAADSLTGDLSHKILTNRQFRPADFDCQLFLPFWIYWQPEWVSIGFGSVVHRRRLFGVRVNALSVETIGFSSNSNVASSGIFFVSFPMQHLLPGLEEFGPETFVLNRMRDVSLPSRFWNGDTLRLLVKICIGVLTVRFNFQNSGLIEFRINCEEGGVLYSLTVHSMEEFSKSSDHLDHVVSCQQFQSYKFTFSDGFLAFGTVSYLYDQPPILEHSILRSDKLLNVSVLHPASVKVMILTKWSWNTCRERCSRNSVCSTTDDAGSDPVDSCVCQTGYSGDFCQFPVTGCSLSGPAAAVCPPNSECLDGSADQNGGFHCWFVGNSSTIERCFRSGFVAVFTRYSVLSLLLSLLFVMFAFLIHAQFFRSRRRTVPIGVAAVKLGHTSCVQRSTHKSVQLEEEPVQLALNRRVRTMQHSLSLTPIFLNTPAPLIGPSCLMSWPVVQQRKSDVSVLWVSKGSDEVILRLVPPSQSSLSLGGCLIVVSVHCIWILLTDEAKLDDRTFATFVATEIMKTHVLDYEGSDDSVSSINMVEHGEPLPEFLQQVFRIGSLVAGCTPSFEKAFQHEDVTFTNCIYEVSERLPLVPLRDAWGVELNPEILINSKVLLFDFGTEVYLWIGAEATGFMRRLGRIYSSWIFSVIPDYSRCLFCPLSPFSEFTFFRSRPLWSKLFEIRQFENDSCPLFRFKFKTDFVQIHKLPKFNPDSTVSVDTVDSILDIEPIRIDSVLQNPAIPFNRSYFYNLQAGVVATDVDPNTCHLELISFSQLTPALVSVPVHRRSYGQFLEDSSYLVECAVDRSEVIVFIWQGRVCGGGRGGGVIDEDLVRAGAHVALVRQENEPPIFWRVFGGLAAIHLSNQRGEQSVRNRLFLFRNTERPGEFYLREVPFHESSLRSFGSFLIFTPEAEDPGVFIWHGRGITESNGRTLKHTFFQAYQLGFPPEFPSIDLDRLVDVHEGSEPVALLEALHPVEATWLYYSWLVNDLHTVENYSVTQRLFALEPYHSHGPELVEIFHPCQRDGIFSALPFSQSVLYDCQQPALFLLETDCQFYIWHGWLDPRECGDSVWLHFKRQRLLLLAAAVELVRETERAAVAIWAGLEPGDFTSLFPLWEGNSTAHDANVWYGRHQNERVSVSELFSLLNKEYFSLDELQAGILPTDIVAYNRVEDFLHPDEFIEAFGVSHASFQSLSVEAKMVLKRRANLFWDPT